MTMIRLATTDDIPHLLKMGKRLHDESVYKALDWDEEKMTELLEMAIESVNFLTLVSEKGYFVGYVTETFFGKDLTALDLTLLAEGLEAKGFIRRYREWAEAMGAKMINLGISTGMNKRISRLYELCGFPKTGYQHSIIGG